MAKQHLLIVDSDHKNLRVLGVSLKKAGFSVTHAINGLDAIEKIRFSIPDMIISETIMPKMDGFELNRQLKSNLEWNDIPVVFLTSQNLIKDKIRALEQGVEDYLTKPVFIREMLARISLVMQRKQRESLANRSSKTKFSGNLQDMGIVDLVQTIDLSRKSGVIHMENENDKGKIFFKEGKVIDAVTNSRNSAEAFYRMLVWTDGNFEIEFINIENKDVIGISTQGLLMEGMRRLDEWVRLQEQLPALSSVFDVDHSIFAERIGEIPDEINELIKHFDAQRTLLEIVNLCRIGDLEALSIISKLYFEGLICEADSLPPSKYTESLLSEDSMDVDDDAVFGLQDNIYDIDIRTSVATVVNISDSEESSTLRLPRIDIAPKQSKFYDKSRHSGFVLALSQIPAPVAPEDENAHEYENAHEDDEHFNKNESLDSKEVLPDSSCSSMVPEKFELINHISERPTKAPTAMMTPVKHDNKYKVELVDDLGQNNISEKTHLKESLNTESDSTIFKLDKKNHGDECKNIDSADNDGRSDEVDDNDGRSDEVDDNDGRSDEVDDDKIHDKTGAEEYGARSSASRTIQIIAIIVIFVAVGSLGYFLLGNTNINNDKLANDNKAKLLATKPFVNADKNKPKTKMQKKHVLIESNNKVLIDSGESLSFKLNHKSSITPEMLDQYSQLLQDAKNKPRKEKMEILKQAVAINRNGSEALSDLAIMMMEQKSKREEAMDYGKRATVIDPDNAKAWLAIGYMYQLQGDADLSREAYKQCSQCSEPAQFVKDCKGLIR